MKGLFDPPPQSGSKTHRLINVELEGWRDKERRKKGQKEGGREGDFAYVCMVCVYICIYVFDRYYM